MPHSARPRRMHTADSTLPISRPGGLRRRRVPVVALLALAVAWALLGVAPAEAAEEAPPPPSAAMAPTRPVIIVAGTTAAQPVADVVYAQMAARLARDGYVPFIFGLPGGGLGSLRASARSLHEFIGHVVGVTGATRVDLVGHSQGGLLGRYTIKYLGDASRVGTLVSLAAPNHGATSRRLEQIFGAGNCVGIPACTQMAPGSSFLNSLNAGDDTIGAVRYVNMASTGDRLVRPTTTAFLDDDGNNTNVLLQWQCPNVTTDHLGFPDSGTVYSGIRRALARQSIQLDCAAG